MLFVLDSLAVREFLCLDDPPGPFDSLEESRVSLHTSLSRVAQPLGLAAKITASGGGWLEKKKRLLLLKNKQWFIRYAVYQSVLYELVLTRYVTFYIKLYKPFLYGS